jgi:hypothetical protein
MQYVIKFNVADEFYFLDSPPAQDARGAITVKRGTESQASNIEVDISIAYDYPFLRDVS